MAISKIEAESLASGAITASALPAGSVLQVVQSESATNIATTSTSVVATGHIASLTPSSTSSKILFILSGGRMTYGTTPEFLNVHLYRKIGAGSYSSLAGEFVSIKLNSTFGVPHSFMYLDSPSTTDEVFYQTYFASGSGNEARYNFSGADTQAMITLMEIAG